MNFEKYTLKAQEILQKAASMATSQQQQIIQTGHLLRATLEADENVTSFLHKKMNVTENLLHQKLEEALKRYPKSSGENPYLSNEAHASLRRAEDSLKHFKDEFIAIEHILIGLLQGSDEVAQTLKSAGYNEKDLKAAIQQLRGGSKVTDQNAEAKYRSLERYSKNLTKLARAGKIDPVIGRDEEIRRVLQILSRRTKNNPILIGEPGVGKTALAEGLAQRIVSGDAPENLKDVTVAALDMGLLVAGAKYKGEFEERLKSVIKEVTDAEGEIILFIDEIHTLVGTGAGGDSAMDAANLLKPALARGELRAIGATTMKEYQKYIEKDKALERRFQTVVVDEPSVQDAISIMRGIKEKYELHHGVQIKDDALIAAVQLSDRYIADRFLPDKAIDLMDEAAAKLRIEIDSMPEELDEVRRKIMQLEIEREAIRREGDTEKEKNLSEEITSLKAGMQDAMQRWESEKQIIEAIQAEKSNIEQFRIEADQAERAGQYNRVAELRYGKMHEAEQNIKILEEKLEALSKDERSLIREDVTQEDIAKVVSRWTGIPLNKMLRTEVEKLLTLEDELHKRVAGQDYAIQAIADAVRRSRAGVQDPKRPIGSFIFLGTTGVGKTELAKALADFLFDDENAMVRIDMSEYQERHAVSRLIGAPPGYVGYDEGGQLTEAVRRRPYSVILLDEIEKAHADVFNILLQVLDDGRLTDNKGRIANFKNTIIIMTSNMGSDIIMQNLEGLEALVDEDERTRRLRRTEQEVFTRLKHNLRPEFLNRVDELIMFSPLTRDQLRQVVDIQLEDLRKQLGEAGLDLRWESDVLELLAERGYDPQFGARPLKRTIQRLVLNELSKQILGGQITKERPVRLARNGQQIVFLNA